MYCNIYKSSKKDEMYIYIQALKTPNDEQTPDAEPVDPLSNVPEGIKKVFGQPQFVMGLELNPERKLARVNVSHVIDSIETNGFFIQMPPEGFINPATIPEGLRGA